MWNEDWLRAHVADLLRLKASEFLIGGENGQFFMMCNWSCFQTNEQKRFSASLALLTI